MSEEPRITTTQPNRRQVLTTTITVGPGAQGYAVQQLPIEQSQVGHEFYITVDVSQLPNRVDDVQFYLLDSANYMAWSAGLPSAAAVRVPRIISGTSQFVANAAGPYYIILDNRHSTFTSKTVLVSVVEFWLSQVEVQIPRPVPSPVPPNPSWLEKLSGWFRRFHLVAALVLFFVIEGLVSVFGLAIVYLAPPVPGLKTGDPWYFVGALAVGGIVIFGIFYSGITGKSVPISPPSG